MLRVTGIDLPLDHSETDLKKAVARKLQVAPGKLVDVTVYKESIDARGRRGGVGLTLVVDVGLADEDGVLRRFEGRESLVSKVSDGGYKPPVGGGAGADGRRPVIIGSGPAGLFCGLALARAGRRPIMLERGKAVGERARDVTGFWNRGWSLNQESNVQFGEGGAGTFSDGKLYTQIRDREGRIRWILEVLVAAGAPEDILWKGRPHIGTDRLIRVVRTLREEITALGGDVRFESKVTGLTVDAGAVRGVEVNGGESGVDAREVIVAIGHSARDTFRMLRDAGVVFEPKGFSMGVRIEHPQRVIDMAQYGKSAGHERLGAAPYKFVQKASNGRKAYSFCMCPGGLVVAASSEEGGVVTNGMSSYSRAEANANSGVMVEVGLGEIAAMTGIDPSEDSLAGLDFQRHWEAKAFELGGSNYRAPVQLVGDFLAGKGSKKLGEVVPSYKPGVVPGDLSECLPGYVAETIRGAIPGISRRLRGFSMEGAVLVGVETRSSSPVRMTRGEENLESLSVKGVFPTGEGAGYAGGIISAAADGLKVAERVIGSRVSGS